MAESGGELQALWHRDPPAVGAPTATSSRSRCVRLGMYAGAVALAIAALVQVLALGWFQLARFLFRGSAAVLVHTGGLDRRTFAVCSVAAIVIDAVLITAVATRVVRRTLRRAPPADERFVARHPFAAASAGLLVALAFVIAGGWRPSPYFPSPLATVVVLASAYWFGLLGVLAMARGADLTWRAVRACCIATRWRASCLATSVVLTGAAVYGLVTTRWYAGPLHAVEAGLAVEAPGHAGEVLAGELAGMCRVADELEPSLAHSSAAPACEFLTSSTRSLDDCLAELRRDGVPDVKQQLRHRGFDPHDVDDAIMKGLLATCTRAPMPRRPRAYFAAVADNQAEQRARDPRHASCEAGPRAEACTATEPAASRALKLARLWDAALCRVGDEAADILRRRLQDDESLREIADHLGLRESDARDAYHHAIAQLGTVALARCDDPTL